VDDEFQEETEIKVVQQNKKKNGKMKEDVS